MKAINHMIILVAILTLGSSLESTLCPIVKCKDPKTTEDKCLEKTSENTYEFAFCLNNQICPTNAIQDRTETCIPKEQKKMSNQVEGEECFSAQQCASQKCENSICVGKKGNEICSSTTQCAKDLYCNLIVRKCEPQIEISKACQDEYDCANNAACFQNHCLRYYSLDIGIFTTRDIFCKSGFAAMNTEGQYLCTKLTLLEPKYECEIEQTECKYKADFGNKIVDITKPCLCSYAYSDKKFCPLDSAHELTHQLNKKRTDHYDPSNIKDYHSSRRHISKNKSVYIEMYEINKFPKFYQAEDCAIGLELGLNKGKGEMIKLSLFALFISLFLF